MSGAPAAAQQQQQQQQQQQPVAGNPLLLAAVEALFRFPPFFSFASKKARSMIIDRATKIGIRWDDEMKLLQAQDWDSRLAAVTRPGLQYPPYYEQPFHAYRQGNLCLEAALEVTMAAKSVHAFVMDPEGKEVDAQGDKRMRSSYGARMLECMAQLGVDAQSTRDVVDLGAATGLSSLALLEALPGATVTGVELSPYFLAVGQYEQEQRQAAGPAGSPPEALSFLHAAAEDTGLPSSSQDLVSLCLVLHELPQSASRAVLSEAFRLLRPGGCLSIMEMSPAAPAFARIMSNPMAFTAFKSTEPWLQEYVSLDLLAAVQNAGFAPPVETACTPRHRTVVAVKRR